SRTCAPVPASVYSRAPSRPIARATQPRSRLASFVKLLDQTLLHQPLYDAVIEKLGFVRSRLANHLPYRIYRRPITARDGVKVLGNELIVQLGAAATRAHVLFKQF